MGGGLFVEGSPKALLEFCSAAMNAVHKFSASRWQHCSQVCDLLKTNHPSYVRQLGCVGDVLVWFRNI